MRERSLLLLIMDTLASGLMDTLASGIIMDTLAEDFEWSHV